jgi:nitrous oxidase accessory protein NosD
MLRKVKWSVALLLGLMLLMVVQFQAADIQSLAQALDANGNSYIDDAEILQAVAYWVSGEPVPGTEGHVISDAQILELISMWINHTSITPKPPPAPPRVCRESISGRVLTVPGQYPTIQQAVDNAGEGDTILVKPGSYPGGIAIDKSIVLEGQEGASLTKIQGDANSKGITVLRAEDVVIRGFAITGSRTGIDIENSSDVCLEQNDISNNLGPGIIAATVSQAVAAYPRGIAIVNNRIAGNVGFGISADDILQLDILGNEIVNTAVKPDGTAGQAIALRGGSKFTVQRNKISQSREFGIFASGITELTIVFNEISHVPDTPGTETGADLSGNWIDECDIGVDVEKSTAIDIDGNRISGSKISGVLVADSIQVVVILNEVTNTLPRSLSRSDYAIGIWIRDDTTGKIWENKVNTALGYGVLIESGSDVQLSDTKVSLVQGKPGVPGRGIGVDGASAEIDESFIGDNAGDGIAVLNGGTAEISDNDISDNRGFGILASADGRVICPGPNRFAGNDEDISEGVPLSCLGS